MILRTSFKGPVRPVDSLLLPLDHCCSFSLALYDSIPENITVLFEPEQESQWAG
jgi:hypothetical protein